MDIYGYSDTSHEESALPVRRTTCTSSTSRFIPIIESAPLGSFPAHSDAITVCSNRGAECLVELFGQWLAKMLGRGMEERHIPRTDWLGSWAVNHMIEFCQHPVRFVSVSTLPGDRTVHTLILSSWCVQLYQASSTNAYWSLAGSGKGLRMRIQMLVLSHFTWTGCTDATVKISSSWWLPPVD